MQTLATIERMKEKLGNKKLIASYLPVPFHHRFKHWDRKKRNGIKCKCKLDVITPIIACLCFLYPLLYIKICRTRWTKFRGFWRSHVKSNHYLFVKSQVTPYAKNIKLNQRMTWPAYLCYPQQLHVKRQELTNRKSFQVTRKMSNAKSIDNKLRYTYHVIFFNTSWLFSQSLNIADDC